MRIRLVVVDDHRLVHQGVRAALAAEEDFEIVGEARNGSEALPLVGRLRPDLVLLDIQMPSMDGLTALRLIRERSPESRVVMLSVFQDATRVGEALAAGAAAYVVKSIAPGELADALRLAATETVATPLGTPATEPSGGVDLGLTERETTILQMVARGNANRAIASELWVTEQTVKFHLTNIYRKLDVQNRTEAARAAYRIGIAQSPAVEQL